MSFPVRKFLTKIKPGISQKTHLFLAASLWTTAGLILMLRGALWLVENNHMLFFPAAIVFGSLKSIFILDKSAKKSIDRILNLADGSCFGAVYSVKTWMLVMGMMLLGYILRQSEMSLTILGLLYATIGWSLFFSSRAGWRAWREYNHSG